MRAGKGLGCDQRINHPYIHQPNRRYPWPIKTYANLLPSLKHKANCAACRKDCQDRLASGQRDMITWMQRLEDKLERVIMMIANANNGLGGVKNGG